MPTQFWGVAVLAAAHLERVDAGLGFYPRIPFGTRGMLVTSPVPRNAWAPRAEPCTIFGVCDTIPNAHWVYQKGHIKARTDLQPQGLSAEDLHWVKLEVGHWDYPDRPLDLPPIEDYDAGAIPQVHPKDVPPATRETATCVACLQTRRGRRQTKAHSLVWGSAYGHPAPWSLRMRLTIRRMNRYSRTLMPSMHFHRQSHMKYQTWQMQYSSMSLSWCPSCLQP